MLSTKTILQIEEYNRLLSIYKSYRRKKNVHIPFDPKYVIHNAISQYNTGEVISDADYIILNVRKFVEGLVYDIYGKNVPSVDLKIYNYRLMLVKDILYMTLRSKALNNIVTYDGLEWIFKHIRRRMMISLLEPGTHVGLLTATINGRLTTQLTLDTFHFTGVGSKATEVNNMSRLINLLKCVSNVTKINVLRVKIYFNEGVTLDEIMELTKSFINLKLVKLIKKISLINDPNIKKSVIEEDREGILDWAKVNSIGDWDLRSIRILFDIEKMSKYFISILDIINILYIKYPMALVIYINDQTIRLCFPGISRKSDEIQRYISYINEIESLQVSGIDNIIDSYIVKDGDEHILVTVGSNLLKVMNLPNIINKYRTISNHIHDVNKVLGIEAARRVLFEGIYNTYRDNRININIAWVYTLVDAMTYMGYFTSVESNSMFKNSTISPFQQITYEQLTKALINISTRGKIDNMKNPSSSILVGQGGEYGTNMHTIKTVINI